MDKITKQTALNAHSWLGVMLSGILFLVCFSGTLAVFHQELERWEQPHIVEMNAVSSEQVDHAMSTFLNQHPEPTDHLYVVFPTSDIPRLVVENDHVAYFADSSGNLIDKENINFTKMLSDLHFYLHLPSSWGMILVSGMGALICALVFTGIVAHKRILRDAFKLRRGGNGQQNTIDVHNRFGLWAAPFHLIIAVSGAFFGLAGLVVLLVSQLYYNGDREAAMAEIFTPDPIIEQPVQAPQMGKVLSQMKSLAPGEPPVFATVHEVNSPQQFIEVYTRVPGEMIYSENYRFDSAGIPIGTAGYKEGHWGKKLVYSMYRLHFGDFAGIASKLIYFVLGVMLTYLCVSGVDIWLAKQSYPPMITRVWSGVVWGSVSALALCAIVDILFSLSLFAVFWLSLVAQVTAAASLKCLDRKIGKKIAGTMLAILLLTYGIKNGAATLALPSLQLNIPLFAFALWCLLSGRKNQAPGG